MADRRLYEILARHFFNKLSTEAKRKKKNQKERNGTACGK
jgi:ribosomal protein S21